MAPAPAAADPRPGEEPGLVSVVVTVRNEATRLGALLDSLLSQEPPFEVLVVDSASTDGTPDLARRYAARHPEVRVLEHPGTRGESRNFGVAQARGEHVAFIDGDCVASPGWLRALRAQLARTAVAAGETQQVGWAPFERLERVELNHKGYDVTLPSCNLAYRRRVFEELGGFDPWFHTAEDIDLNYRAVDRGHELAHVPHALVFHKTRTTLRRFLKQAFWNGYGRKQLTLKHGRLWDRYSLRKMFWTQLTLFAAVRLGVALLGYLYAKARERPRDRAAPSAAPRPAPAPAPAPDRFSGPDQRS